MPLGRVAARLTPAGWARKNRSGECAGSTLAHNHPSGAAEPSRANEHQTQTLKTGLQLVNVRVPDHLVVTANAVVSFAERGLL